ncbi:MAG: oligosaccharide flippase family protein [Pseudomonadales bacterium]|nr:oligosaccharide flippase family protein [Pseudomonadales bacterium]
MPGELIKKISTYTLGEFVSKGLSAILIPVYSYLLSPAQYADLALFNIVLALTSIVVGLGAGTALLRFYFTLDAAAFRTMVRSLLACLLTLGAILLGISSLQADALSQSLGGLSYLGCILPALFCGVLLGTFEQFVSALLRIREEAHAFAIMTMVSSTLKTGLIVAAVVWQTEVSSIAWATLAAIAIMSVYYLRYLGRFLGGETTLSRASLVAALGLSLPVVPHNLSHWILNLSDRYLLEHNVDAEELGLYAFAFSLTWLMAALYHALNNAFAPEYGHLVRDDAPGRDALVSTRIELHLMLTFVVFWGAYLLLSPAIMLIADSDYRASVSFVPWLVTGALCYGIYYPFANVVTVVVGRTRVLATASITGAVLQLTLNIWLIPRYGALAAATNVIVGYGVLAVGVIAYSMIKTGIRVSPRTVMQFALATAAVVAIYEATIDVPLAALVALRLTAIVVLSWPLYIWFRHRVTG